MEQTQANARANSPFFRREALLLLGMSRTKSKFGNALQRHLSSHGYTVYPLHPEGGEVQGVTTYSAVEQVPQPVDAAVICLPPERTLAALETLAAAGVGEVFLQQGSESEAVLQRCRELGLTTYYKSCAILNSRPTGGHAIHAFFARLFGGWARRLD